MKINQIILFVIIISLCGCNNTTKQTVKQGEMNATGQIDQALTKLSIQELKAINRNLSAQIRENFRSWSYKEPERWEFLSDKFADEVIRSCPDAESKKENIAQFFLTYLKQRADIMNDKATNKQDLTNRSNAELKYNLSFLIGVEGYQKWQSFSKNELQKFNLLSDSLHKVITCSYAKNPKLKITKP